MIEDVEARNEALRIAQEARAEEQAKSKAQDYNPWPTAEEALSTWDNCNEYPVDYVKEWLKNAEEANKENEEPEQEEQRPLAERIRGGNDKEEYEDEDHETMPPLMEHSPIITSDDEEEEEEAQPPVEAGEGWGPSIPEEEVLQWVEVIERAQQQEFNGRCCFCKKRGHKAKECKNRIRIARRRAEGMKNKELYKARRTAGPLPR
jgi:hypothetical protein